MEGTIFSIIPALIMLILVLLTRKVLLSLGAGIVIGALLIHDFSIITALKEIGAIFIGIFVSGGEWNTGDLLLIGFLLLLGVMTALLQATGGSRAFGEWMIKRIKTRTGAQLMTPVLGLIIFIDDYFNALAVGQIARPLTDLHKISRAKLAYFIDSTSAPITVLSPISSWGAYLIGIIGGLLTANEVTDYQPLEAFIKMIPFNLYALGSLLLVFLVAYFKMDIGPMRKHETRALQEGEVLDPDSGKVPGDLSNVFSSHEKGSIYHLLVPIAVLLIATITSMIITGIYAISDNVTLLSIFENTDVNLSLFIGGATAVLIALIFHLQQDKPKAQTSQLVFEGIKTMLPAIYILLLAWMIGTIIGKLETGEYLANIVEQANISSSFLPVIFFLIAGVMALATGTSWGTFGIMLPIAAEVTVIADVSLLLPALAAVLAGSVFGDHCTPISDTTILSSTGAGSNHIDHVVTQLPYAIISALASAIGYVIIGITHVALFGFVSTFLLILGCAYVIHTLLQKK
ncbi:Na+/H+ antiporter NhaC [Oceanobacillus limi]|uniref:Na+/H+ antiporter NhaC n=1 Tax=Oceanobacillus limi TaxID=930131 RepID=A0A1I0DQ39_9BACI|nr:Na+/H+ antiporter NhaC family protein [Oceanobacillus limi]SET34659.1 Na+/H+ antiporter NhaC [Oceanobacillus limi]